MKHKKTAAALLALVLLCAACLAYVNDFYRADEAAVAAMRPGAGIRIVHDANTVAFIPDSPMAGFIFYPGGKVEHSAYAPLMRGLAEAGVLCVLVEMPLNLAVLDADAAHGIPDRYPQVEHWYIGGHSLGGSMAASHAARNADAYDGLVLLAAYSTADLQDSGLRVISVYGSADGVLNMEKYNENRTRLPDDFSEHIIDGGNHAGFGSYGAQAGDGTPSIRSETQQEITIQLLAEFFICT